MARRRSRRRSSGAKYAVKCGKRVVSRHRKKSAANRARRSGCRVVKVRGAAAKRRRSPSRRGRRSRRR